MHSRSLWVDTTEVAYGTVKMQVVKQPTEQWTSMKKLFPINVPLRLEFWNER